MKSSGAAYAGEPQSVVSISFGFTWHAKPKSANLIQSGFDSITFSAFISRWMIFLECYKKIISYFSLISKRNFNI